MMKNDSRLGELIAVISRSGHAFTQSGSVQERMSASRQLAAVVGRSHSAYGEPWQTQLPPVSETNDVPGGTQIPSGGAGIRKRESEPAVAANGIFRRWVSRRSERIKSTSVVALYFLSLMLLVVEIIPAPGILPAAVAGFRDWHPGLLALASLVIIVSAAPHIHYQKTRPIRHFIVPLATASGVLSVARWPVFFPNTPAAISIQVLAILGLVWLLAKILLLQRFSTMYCSRAVLPESELERLLPFQEAYLRQLREAIFSGRIDQSSRIVQLEGNWGQGKSFVIERLGLFLENKGISRANRDECAVVVINVWEQQSEPDLHLAIVEQILSHKKYWYPYGWLYYPVSLFIARNFKDLRFALSAGKAATKAEVQIPLTLPRPTGRRYLAQQVDRVRRRKGGTRTVIVLDEIDRATTRVAQTAMTFARRSLDMPSVVVVLSYVDSIIRYKAFNPLVKSLPDLDSTMQAVIFDRGPEKAVRGPMPSPNGLSRPGGPFTERDPASLRAWEAWQNAAEARLSSAAAQAAGDSGNPSEDVKLETRDSEYRLADTLRLAFANAKMSQRRQLQEKFSEKYLGTDRIQLRPLELEDVADVVVRFDTVRNRLLGLLGLADGAELDQDQGRALVQKITSALQTLQAASTERHEPPTLRKLEGALLRCLSGISLSDVSERFSDEFIAAVVLTAYDAAARGLR